MGLGRRSLTFSTASSALWLTGALLFSGSALAQTDDQRAGARAAATAGGQAFMAGKWADAVDLFTRAESMLHSPVHLLYTARSYEKLGALVKAREAYIRITNEELPAGASQPVREAKADAEKELDALEPRVPYVSVVVQGAGPKPVTVTMDGVQVPAALLGVPRPVDPGDHRFDAVAEGMDGAESRISVKEAGSQTVVLTLHPGAGGATPAPVGYAAPVAPQEGGAPVADSGGHHGPSPLTWVAFGVGAVGLGIGTVFALQASSKESDANKIPCNQLGPDGTNTYCPPRVASLDDDARSANTISLVGFIAGGVGVAAGVTLLLVTSKHEKSTPTAAHVTPWLGLGSAGVSGRF